jgi:hypothetical protein
MKILHPTVSKHGYYAILLPELVCMIMGSSKVIHHQSYCHRLAASCCYLIQFMLSEPSCITLPDSAHYCHRLAASCYYLIQLTYCHRLATSPLLRPMREDIQNISQKVWHIQIRYELGVEEGGDKTV